MIGSNSMIQFQQKAIKDISEHGYRYETRPHGARLLYDIFINGPLIEQCHCIIQYDGTRSMRITIGKDNFAEYKDYGYQLSCWESEVYKEIEINLDVSHVLDEFNSLRLYGTKNIKRAI